jgi:flagellar basal body-associated protein FliL
MQGIMAKPSTKKKPAATSETAEAPASVRSARGLLVAAMLLSAASLGGGFVLARMAFETDAKEFEPDYVDIAESPAENADLEDPETEASSERAELEGFLEFEDIVTNINIDGASGEAKRSFLKLSVILVYRPDSGARELIESRQPFMRDLFTTFARSLTESEIRGAAGLMGVKSELLKRARAATGNNLPQDVLIRDIIIQ